MMTKVSRNVDREYNGIKKFSGYPYTLRNKTMGQCSCFVLLSQQPMAQCSCLVLLLRHNQ